MSCEARSKGQAAECVWDREGPRVSWAYPHHAEVHAIIHHHLVHIALPPRTTCTPSCQCQVLSPGSQGMIALLEVVKPHQVGVEALGSGP